MIKKNIGNVDRIIRLFVGLSAIMVSIFVGLSNIISILVLIAGIIILLTSIISFCPVYSILRVDSIFEKEKD